MRINGAGSGAKAGQRGGFNAAVRGKAGAPDVPEAGFTESELPIRFDAFFALALDKFMPEPERVLGFVKVGLFDDRSQDVKIVDFAEDVLKARSEERRVGKECRSGWSGERCKKNIEKLW